MKIPLPGHPLACSTPVARATARGIAGFTLVGALGCLGACAAPGESHLVAAPPPPEPIRMSGQLDTPPRAPLAGTLIISHIVPALPPRQPAPAAPSPQHVWLAGYWTWRDYEYEWKDEHWELPPRVGASWVRPRWVQHGNFYRFYVAHWD